MTYETRDDIANEEKFCAAFNAMARTVRVQKIPYSCYFCDIALLAGKNEVVGLIEFKQKLNCLNFSTVHLDLIKLMSLFQATRVSLVPIFYAIENAANEYHMHRMRDKYIYKDVRLCGNPARPKDIHPAVLIPAQEFMPLREVIEREGF